MKYFIFFLLCCVALSAAAPQFITTFPGFFNPAVAPVAPGTLVAGPTVINGVPGVTGTRVISPGYIGAAII